MPIVALLPDHRVASERLLSTSFSIAGLHVHKFMYMYVCMYSLRGGQHTVAMGTCTYWSKR